MEEMNTNNSLTTDQPTIEQLQDRISSLEKENLSTIFPRSSLKPKKGLKEKLKKILPAVKTVHNTKKDKKTKEDLLEKFERAKIALKICYNGRNYQGFARQENVPNTIEEHLFSAFERVKMIKNIESSDYSRCGRTDKGVSSLGNVVALQLRTKKPRDPNSKDKSVEEEYILDYVRMLNGCLPSDIRVLAQAHVPNTFNSRYECKYRVYKYFFYKRELNLERMNEAGKKFVGSYDFRNFCKLNLTNTANHVREIMNFSIEPVDFPARAVLIDPRMDLYTFTITGNGFLWHQIRCMVAILFLVGQGAEDPSIIEEMLDVDKYPRKPNYEMAPEANLILYDCYFENLEFVYNYDTCFKLFEQMREIIMEELSIVVLFNFGLKLFTNFKVENNKCYPAIEGSVDFKERFLAEDSKILRDIKAHKKLRDRQTAKSFEETADSLKGKKLEIFQNKKQKQEEYEQSLKNV